MAANCSCFQLISQGKVVPRDHIAHVETLTTGRVVIDMISRKPDVFAFLFEVLTSQIAHPERFTPPPVWFSTATAVDMGRVKRAVARVNWREWRKWDVADDAELARRAGDDAYMIARSMVLNCPLQLHGVSKMLATDVRKTGAVTWQQFKVTWSEEVEQMWERQGRGATPEYLYHGSRLSNWYSILRNGLRVMSHTPWMSAGAAYGDGIYCSNTLNVSWGYSGGVSGAIVIGVYEIWNAAEFVKGKCGATKDIDHGIYVVPREDQLLLRYLIYMPNTRGIDIAELDRMLRDEWQSKGSRKAVATRQKNGRVEARLRKEVAALTDAGIRVSAWDTVQVRCWLPAKGTAERNIDIFIPHQYPFSAPELHVALDNQRVLIEDWNPKRTLLEILKPHL
jgi:hypothetical protein